MCLCWFARRSRLATSGANLYIFLLCFVLFRFRLLLLSFSPWPFVQSFFDMHAAPTATRRSLTVVCGLFFVSVLFFEDVTFSEHHVPLPFICMQSTCHVSLRMVCFLFCFQPCDYKLDFDISLLFEICINQLINQSTSFLPRVAI